MLVREVMARLGTLVPDLSGRIEGAAGLAALVQAGKLPQVTPAAHVVPAGLRAREPMNMTGCHCQQLDETFSVLITIRAYDSAGDAGLEPLDVLAPQVIAALCGWVPEGAPEASPVRLLSGRVVSLQGGAIVYQLDFATSSHLRIFP